METKQSAVEWLISKCNDSLNREPIDPTHQEIGYSKALSHIIILLEEAKAMEKQQIIDARVDGDENHTFNSMMREEYANDYYKETYGK